MLEYSGREGSCQSKPQHGISSNLSANVSLDFQKKPPADFGMNDWFKQKLDNHKNSLVLDKHRPFRHRPHERENPNKEMTCIGENKMIPKRLWRPPLTYWLTEFSTQIHTPRSNNPITNFWKEPLVLNLRYFPSLSASRHLLNWLFNTENPDAAKRTGA